jgi:hypothetical protein
MLCPASLRNAHSRVASCFALLWLAAAANLCNVSLPALERASFSSLDRSGHYDTHGSTVPSYRYMCSYKRAQRVSSNFLRCETKVAAKKERSAHDRRLHQCIRGAGIRAKIIVVTLERLVTPSYRTWHMRGCRRCSKIYFKNALRNA